MTIIPILQSRRLRVRAIVISWRREPDPPVTALPTKPEKSCLDRLLFHLQSTKEQRQGQGAGRARWMLLGKREIASQVTAFPWSTLEADSSYSAWDSQWAKKKPRWSDALRAMKKKKCFKEKGINCVNGCSLPGLGRLSSKNCPERRPWMTLKRVSQEFQTICINRLWKPCICYCFLDENCMRAMFTTMKSISNSMYGIKQSSTLGWMFCKEDHGFRALLLWDKLENLGTVT